MAAPAELRKMNFLDFMRLAGREGLVPAADRLRNYRELRGQTSAAYDHEVAEEIAGQLRPFLLGARFTLDALQRQSSTGD